MTISTPQPEYITETHEVVDDALEQREQPPSSEAQFKLVPTAADWMSAYSDLDGVDCPVCFSRVHQAKVDDHTAWHQTLADIIQLLAR